MNLDTPHTVEHSADGTIHNDEGSIAHPSDPSQPALADQGWEAILDYGKAQDEKVLSEWKDELANLLTFTGLFSAVVTGFVVLTLPMLQPDPAATSVVILAQISQQLSSLSLGPQFINSTIQPNDVITDVAPIDLRIIRLNILWVTSLTLTLMAAFYIIAVQQWLRRIPLPPNLATREAVRLWRLRQSGLSGWKVPSIISLLPVLVQISVVLFLVGLFFLLEILHHPTALVLLVFGSSLLGLFFLSAISPLIWQACPYKTPVIPAALTVIQLFAIPILCCLWLGGATLGTIVTAIWDGLAHSISMVLWILLKLSKSVTTQYVELPASQVKRTRAWFQYTRIVLANAAHVIGFWFLNKCLTLGSYIIATESGTWWNRSELLYIERNAQGLDCHTLSWTCAQNISLWQQRPELLDACLRDIPASWRPFVGTMSLNKTLLSRYHDVSMLLELQSLPVVVPRSNNLPRLVSELEEFLWRCLPSTDQDSGDGDTTVRLNRGVLNSQGHFPELICLLYKSNVHSPCPEKRVTTSSIANTARYLIKARAQQDPVHVITKSRERLPATLLFGCCFRGYQLTNDEMRQSIAWTLETLRTVTPRLRWQAQSTRGHIPSHNVVLGSLATTLIGCACDNALEAGILRINHAVLSRMLELFAEFLDSKRQVERIWSSACVALFFPTNMHILITAEALASVANSITRLAFKGHLAQSKECPSYAVMRCLKKICAHAYGYELHDTERYVNIFFKYEGEKTGVQPPSPTPVPVQFLHPDRPQ